MSKDVHRAKLLSALGTVQHARRKPDARMAEVVGVSRETYNRTINGRFKTPALHCFDAWAAELDVPVSAILPGADPGLALIAIGAAAAIAKVASL